MATIGSFGSGKINSEVEGKIEKMVNKEHLINKINNYTYRFNNLKQQKSFLKIFLNVKVL